MAKNESQTQTEEQKKVVVPSFNFKVTKIVTVPLLKPSIDVPFYVTITGAIFLGKQVDDKMEQAHLVNVTNLETSESQQIIVPAVLLSLLTEEYPDNSYIGKSFQLIKHAKPSGKGYHPFTMNEIEIG